MKKVSCPPSGRDALSRYAATATLQLVSKSLPAFFCIPCEVQANVEQKRCHLKQEKVYNSTTTNGESGVYRMQFLFIWFAMFARPRVAAAAAAP